jgi:hypothetical protein
MRLRTESSGLDPTYGRSLVGVRSTATAQDSDTTASTTVAAPRCNNRRRQLARAARRYSR